MSRDGSLGSLGEMAPQAEFYAKASGSAGRSQLFRTHGKSRDKQALKLRQEREQLRGLMAATSVGAPEDLPQSHDLLPEHAIRECLAHALLLLVHMLVPIVVRSPTSGSVMLPGPPPARCHPVWSCRACAAVAVVF